MYEAYKRYVKKTKAKVDTPGADAAPVTTTKHQASKEDIERFKAAFAGKTESGANTASDVSDAEAKLKRQEALLKEKQRADALLAQIESLMATLEPYAKKGEERSKLLSGDLDVEVQSDSKLVRIFTSSTFTDTRHERNALMERVYGKLKTFCKDLGYEFQVVDMRWGIRDESTNDHMTTEICLKEIQACQKLSIGPNFVTFLSHKYGQRPLRRVIDAEEFEKLLTSVSSEEDRTFIYRWYKRDENQVPTAYVLQPISSNIEQYVPHGDPEKFQNAKAEWWGESNRLMTLLMDAAEAQLAPEAAHDYVMSVTETEIREALRGSAEQAKRCLWFHRIIPDIHAAETSALLPKYKDIHKDDRIQTKINDLIKALKEDVLTKAIPPENIKSFEIHWSKNGVDPTLEEHSKYIADLCRDFENILQDRIKTAIEANAKGILSSKLCVEVLQHTLFCRQKCSVFYGRESVLKEVKEALLADNKLPYIIHGNSGCGKTSLLAKIASEMKSWLQKSPCLVLRFVGTTPESSSLRSLLLSSAEQIKAVYGIKGLTLKSQNIEMKLIVAYFHMVLRQASASRVIKLRPLVIIFDSLDQLSNEGNPQALTWIPKQVPENVYFLVSTLPDTDHYQYGYLPKLLHIYEQHKDSRFLNVPEIPEDDARATVESWLAKEKRRLNGEQMELVIAKFKRCKLPLFLKLCFDEACKWSSFTKVDDSSLADNVHDAINATFSSMERKHGGLLTSRTFAYITASKSGLSEVELEDILSCDDDVLNDVYQYWTPPIRRLPPLLLVRLKSDISQYLVERGSGGIKVIYWYHRQFIETARERYLTGKGVTVEERKLVHRNIAEYFLGKWENENLKPFTTKNGIKDAQFRLATSQQISTKGQYNLRKLEELAMQLIQADMFNEFGDTIIMSLEWHLAKMKAFSYRELMNEIEYGVAEMASKNDVTEWRLMKDALRLSEAALLYNVELLPSQILGRVEQGLESYRQQCRQYEGCALFLSQPALTAPGGELVYCLAGHEAEMTHALMTQDQTYVITANEDMSLKVWDIKKGVDVLTIEDCFGNKDNCSINNLFLCCGDKYIVASVHVTVAKKKGDVLFAFNTRTGLLVYKRVVLYSEACAVFNNNTHLAIASSGKIQLFDVENNTYLDGHISAKWVKSGTFQITLLSGAQNIVCGAHGDERFVWVYDVAANKELHCIEVQEKPEKRKKENKDDEGDDEDDDDDDEGWTPDVVAVSPNAKTVLTVSLFDNNLHLFDVLSGQRTGLIKGDDSDTIQNGIFLSDSVFAACASQENELMLWDVENRSLSYMFKHEESLIKALATKDLSTFVTITSDSVVRVWKPKEVGTKTATQQTQDPGTSQKVAKENARELVSLPGSARYVVLRTDVVLRDAEKGSHACIKLCDVYDNVTVRTVYLTTSIRKIKMISEKKVLILDTQSKFHVLDLEGLCLEKTLQGFCGSSYFFPVTTEQDKEVVCLTKFCSNLKLISLTSGKTTAIIKTGLDKRLSNTLVVSEDGSTAVVEEDADENNCLLVFSLQTRQLLHKLTWIEGGKESLNLADEFITKDGRYLIHSVFREPPGIPEWMTTFLLVWDLKEGKLVHTLYDKENQAVKNCIKTKKTSDQLEGLDIDHVVHYEYENGVPKVAASSSDHAIRVFDVVTGELEHTVRDHHTKDVYALTSTHDTPSERGKYCLATSMDDYAMWLFDLENWSKVACFKADSHWKACVMVDNYTVVAAEGGSGANSHARLHVLKLHRGADTQPVPEPEVLFQPNDAEANLEIAEEDKNVSDPDDPDTDTPAPESDISEDEND